jgi:hypothetical protein
MSDNGGFSFRDLIKPGEGAAAALIRDLEARHIKESFNAKADWFYTGEAGILQMHGVTFKGQPVPDKYRDLIGPPTRCHFNALVAARDHPELRYFTGMYTVGRMVCQHSWCVDPDGGVVELTFPTEDIDPGTPVATQPGVPPERTYVWMPPEYWAYHGLEFKTSFVEALIEKHGFYLPVLEPGNPWHDQLMSTFYSPDGFPVT